MAEYFKERRVRQDPSGSAPSFMRCSSPPGRKCLWNLPLVFLVNCFALPFSCPRRPRAAAEDAHAKHLLKLSKKAYVSDKSSLGLTSSMWDLIISELLESVNAHSALAQRITEEVEKPLREVMNSSEWTNLKHQEQSVYKTPKEYEDILAKVNKYKKTADKASGKKAEKSDKKLIEANQALDACRVVWESEASATYDIFQSIDENRIESLKHIFKKYQAADAEALQSQLRINGELEHNLDVFEVQSEIDNFCTQSRLRSAKSRSMEDVANATIDASRNVFPKLMASLNRSVSMDAGNNDKGAPKSPVSHSPTEASQAQPSVPKPLVDDEGYSIVPATAPWGAAASVEPGEQVKEEAGDDDEASVMTQTRIQVRIKSEKIEEDSEDAANAFSKLSGALQAANSVRRHNRGRREVRNSTMSSTGTADTSVPAFGGLQSPIPSVTSPQASPGPTSFAPREADSSSAFCSGRAPESPQTDIPQLADPPQRPPTKAPSSVAAPALDMDGGLQISASAGFSPRRPSAPADALPTWRALVSETVSVLIQAGVPMKMVVAGEISLQRTPDSRRPPPTMLWLQHTDNLERVVLNSTLLSEVGRQEGEFRYAVNAEGLVAASGGPEHDGEEPRPVTVLKYQVRVSEKERMSFCPIGATVLWRCEPRQASLLVTYGPNAECHPALRDQRVEGLAVMAGLEDGGELGSCVSKPEGIWARERRALFWDSLEDLVTPPVDNRGAKPEWARLLARIGTSEQASGTSTVVFRFVVRGTAPSGVSVQADTGLVDVVKQYASGKYLVSS